MKIDMKKIPCNWLQDEDGNKYDAVYNKDGLIINDKQYQHNILVNQCRTEILKPVFESNVNKCRHPKNKMKTNFYNKFHNEHRICEECGGSQSRKIGEDWPDKWNCSGSMFVGTSITLWDNDLVTTIVRSGEYNVKEAILIVSHACEDCLNVLRNKYGLETKRQGSWTEGLRKYRSDNCRLCKD